MGDRGNIVVEQSDGSRIFLYAHWDGSELPGILQRALKKRWRWSDEAYLTRIIFSEMIKDSVMAETGYGISTYLIDNQHPLLVVNCDKDRVSRETEKGKNLKAMEL